MNSLKLPDEIIRKIYQFIHPAFEYEKYIQALTLHDEEKRCFMNIIHNNMQTQDLTGKISFNGIVSSYALLMNDHLIQISDFLERNKLFTRPYYRTDLKFWQFKTAWQFCYKKEHILEMEECITWDTDHLTNTPVLNIVKLLRNGSISELMLSCKENNIIMNEVDFKEENENTLLSVTEIVRRTLVKKLMTI